MPTASAMTPAPASRAPPPSSMPVWSSTTWRSRRAFACSYPTTPANSRRETPSRTTPPTDSFSSPNPFRARRLGSSIQIYNESGTLEESINGFSFSDASSVIPVRISINPTSRSAWVNGPQADQSRGVLLLGRDVLREERPRRLTRCEPRRRQQRRRSRAQRSTSGQSPCG